MKKLLFLFILFVFINSSVCFASEESIEEQKKEIIAVYNSNNLNEAYNMISKITEKDRDFELWYLLANISQDMNKEENAIFFLKKSIALNPEFDKAHYNLANIYLKQNRYNSAINEYKQAIKYKKDFPYYYYNLACAYIEQKDYNEAKSALKKAIYLKNTDASFYYNLAFVNKELNKPKEAEKALEMYNKLYKEEDL